MVGMVNLGLLIILAQQPEAEYLKEIAQAWKEKLPEDRFLGVYVGRKWLGHLRLHVERKTGLVWTITFQLQRQKAITDVYMTDSLEIIKVVDRGNELKTKEPGAVWEPLFLPLYKVPDKARVYSMSAEDHVELRRLPDKVTRTIGKRGEFGVLQIGQARWYLDADGKPAEYKKSGHHTRMRVISEEQVGKDLVEPLDLTDPQRAMIAVYRAMKKGDKEAFLAAFDIERFTRDKVPEYATCSNKRKQEILEATRTFLTGEVMSGEDLPEAGLIEDWFAMVLESTEKDGSAEVRDGDGTVWKLSKSADGKWLIYALTTD